MRRLHANYASRLLSLTRHAYYMAHFKPSFGPALSLLESLLGLPNNPADVRHAVCR